MMFVNHLFVLLLAVILTEGGVSTHNPFYCYSQDPIRPQLGMFRIRTPYEIRRGQSINKHVSTCKPSKFWMFLRHGTRFPFDVELTLIFEHSERLQNEILSNYDKGRTSLCASDVELIRNWKFDPNVTLADAGLLASAGWNEAKEIAQRYQVAFPSIFSSTYTPRDYFFRSTTYPVTKATIRAFADGLFGVDGHKQVKFEDIPEPNADYLLRANINCPLYSEVTAIAPEQVAFRESVEYEEMRGQVSAKLGFHGSHSLRSDEINVLDLLCMYEQIWNLNSTSPFCAAFSIANHQVLEYNSDLFYYYKVGYGHPDYRRLFENINCFLMQNMVRFLQSNDVNDHKARIFTEHGSGFFLLINLGVFEDSTPLTRHNFAQQIRRLWNMSLVSPMAFNLAIIRYDCVDGDNDILFLFNEIPLQIAGCDPNGVCKQSLILKRFGRFLDANCMDVFCTNS